MLEINNYGTLFDVYLAQRKNSCEQRQKWKRPYNALSIPSLTE